MRWRSVADGRGAIVAALVAAAVLGAAESPSPEPSAPPGDVSSMVVTCDATATRATQVVRCEASQAPADLVLRLTARTGTGEDAELWPGTAPSLDGGTTVIETAIPCEIAGMATVTVATESDNEDFRHREDVGLPGSCQPPWLLTGAEWTRVAATVLVAVTSALVLVVRRRSRPHRRGPRHPAPSRRVSRRGRPGHRWWRGPVRRRSRSSRTRRR